MQVKLSQRILVGQTEGGNGGHVVENPQTGCKGTSFPSLTPGHEPVVTGPSHNQLGKNGCRCLSLEILSPSDMRAHIDRFLEERAITPEEVGIVSLRLRLRMPLPRALQIEPHDDENHDNELEDIVTDHVDGKDEVNEVDDGVCTWEKTSPEMLLFLELKLRRTNTFESFPPLSEEEDDEEDAGLDEKGTVPNINFVTRSKQRSQTMMEEVRGESEDCVSHQQGLQRASSVKTRRAESSSGNDGWSAIRMFCRP